MDDKNIDIEQHEKTILLVDEFFEDLRLSNKGWLGSLCLQDYGRMNEMFTNLTKSKLLIENGR